MVARVGERSGVGGEDEGGAGRDGGDGMGWDTLLGSVLVFPRESLRDGVLGRCIEGDYGAEGGAGWGEGFWRGGIGLDGDGNGLRVLEDGVGS